MKMMISTHHTFPRFKSTHLRTVVLVHALPIHRNGVDLPVKFISLEMFHLPA
jgi:hypothetical protein